MSSIVAPGKDFTFTFLHWHDILFSQYQIQWNHRQWQWAWCIFSICDGSCFLTFIRLYYLLFSSMEHCVILLANFFQLVVKLGLAPCSCCCVSGDKLLFLHWLLTSSLKVLQFWKFSIFCFVKVSEGTAVNCSFATFN